MEKNTVFLPWNMSFLFSGVWPLDKKITDNSLLVVKITNFVKKEFYCLTINKNTVITLLERNIPKMLIVLL